MRKILFAAMALFVACGLSLPVHAATSGTNTATVTINGGQLEVITAPNNTTLGALTLNGTTQTTNGNLTDLTVADNRGNGAGWNVTVSATQFTSAASKTIPTGSLKLNSITTPLVNMGGSTSAVPTVTGSNWTIDNGSAVKVVTAATDAGMGQYEIKFPVNALSLTVIPSTFAGTYTSTLTWTIVTGP